MPSRRNFVFWTTALLFTCYILSNFEYNSDLLRLQIWQPMMLWFETSFHSSEYEESPYPITFVSGYIDIGKIDKYQDGLRSKESYYAWVKIYGRLNSPLVMFSSDPEFLLEVAESRRKFESITKLIFIEDIYSLPGFKYYNETKKLYESPEYPKITTITTNAKYACVMHSKYDFLKTSIENNFFKTPYFAWTDIGSMRYMGDSDEPLNVTIPPQMNNSRIGFFQKFDLNVNLGVADVMRSYSVWVTGNFFIGTTPVMSKFVDQYQRFVDEMISLNLMSTDENILYAMYTKEGHTPDMVDIQVYHGPNDSCDPWFHMMYLVTNHSCLRKK